MDANEIKSRGLMLVLSSPSGAGKTTLSRMILADDPSITMSVSATTRPARPGERDGIDYYFIEPAEYDAMVEEGGFLEHAAVFDQHYGTPKKPVLDALERGKDILFDIDWQGTQQLMENAKDDLVTIFLLPPSTAELERRLRARAQDSEEVVARRMAGAADEISHYAEYDYVLVNDDLDACFQNVKTIIAAERLKRQRQTGLSRYITSLIEGE